MLCDACLMSVLRCKGHSRDYYLCRSYHSVCSSCMFKCAPTCDIPEIGDQANLSKIIPDQPSRLIGLPVGRVSLRLHGTERESRIRSRRRGKWIGRTTIVDSPLMIWPVPKPPRKTKFSRYLPAWSISSAAASVSGFPTGNGSSTFRAFSRFSLL